MSAPTARRSVLYTMSRIRRRVLVLTMQIGMAAYALALALSGADSWSLVVVIICLQAIYMLIFVRVIRPIAGEISDRKDYDLDERQVAVRDRAHHHAYQILTMVITAVTSASMIATGSSGAGLEMTYWHFLGLFFFFTNLGISLPASVIAWNEPDPKPE